MSSVQFVGLIAACLVVAVSALTKCNDIKPAVLNPEVFRKENKWTLSATLSQYDTHITATFDSLEDNKLVATRVNASSSPSITNTIDLDFTANNGFVNYYNRDLKWRFVIKFLFFNDDSVKGRSFCFVKCYDTVNGVEVMRCYGNKDTTFESVVASIKESDIDLDGRTVLNARR